MGVHMWFKAERERWTDWQTGGYQPVVEMIHVHRCTETIGMFKGNGGVQEHSHALKKLEAGSGALSDQLSWQIGKAIKMVWTWTNLLHMETTWKPMLQNLSFDELDVFLTDLSLMTLQSCSAHHLRGAVLHDKYTYFKAHRKEGHKRGWYWFQMSYLHK